jgi:hypothetical protein
VSTQTQVVDDPEGQGQAQEHAGAAIVGCSDDMYSVHVILPRQRAFDFGSTMFQAMSTENKTTIKICDA